MPLLLALFAAALTAAPASAGTAYLRAGDLQRGKSTQKVRPNPELLLFTSKDDLPDAVVVVYDAELPGFQRVLFDAATSGCDADARDFNARLRRAGRVFLAAPLEAFYEENAGNEALDAACYANVEHHAADPNRGGAPTRRDIALPGEAGASLIYDVRRGGILPADNLTRGYFDSVSIRGIPDTAVGRIHTHPRGGSYLFDPVEGEWTSPEDGAQQCRNPYGTWRGRGFAKIPGGPSPTDWANPARGAMDVMVDSTHIWFYDDLGRHTVIARNDLAVVRGGPSQRPPYFSEDSCIRLFRPRGPVSDAPPADAFRNMFDPGLSGGDVPFD